MAKLLGQAGMDLRQQSSESRVTYMHLQPYCLADRLEDRGDKRLNVRFRDGTRRQDLFSFTQGPALHSATLHYATLRGDPVEAKVHRGLHAPT